MSWLGGTFCHFKNKHQEYDLLRLLNKVIILGQGEIFPCIWDLNQIADIKSS